MKPKTSTQTTTSTTAPPGFISDQQQFGLDQARDIYDQGAPGFYPDQTYASFSPQTQSAIDLATSRATNGNPAVSAATGNIADTLNGNYLNSNPYLDTAIDNASQAATRNYANTVFPTIAGSFSGAGRYGSGLYANAQDSARQDLANSLATTAGNMSYSNYNAERGNQLTAAGLAPQLANQDYTDIAALGAAGSKVDAQSQLGINEDMARYQYPYTSQNQSLDQFLQRLGVVTPGAGNTATSTQPVSQPSAFGQLAGLGLTAAGMYFGGPMGAAAGSAVGGGLFGGGGMLSSPSPMPTSYSGATTLGGYSSYGNGNLINWY